MQNAVYEMAFLAPSLTDGLALVVALVEAVERRGAERRLAEAEELVHRAVDHGPQLLQVLPREARRRGRRHRDRCAE